MGTLVFGLYTCLRCEVAASHGGREQVDQNDVECCFTLHVLSIVGAGLRFLEENLFRAQIRVVTFLRLTCFRANGQGSVSRKG